VAAGKPAVHRRATTIGTLSVIHSFAAQIYPPEIRATGIIWVSAVGRLGAIAGPTWVVSDQPASPLQQNFHDLRHSRADRDCLGMLIRQGRKP